MNIVRQLKLKKLNGELTNLTEGEKLLISMFDGLKEYDNYYYNNNGVCFFINHDEKIFFYSYINVYIVFNKTLNLKHYQIVRHIEDMLEKYTNFNGYTVNITSSINNTTIERKLGITGRISDR